MLISDPSILSQLIFMWLAMFFFTIHQLSNEKLFWVMHVFILHARHSHINLFLDSGRHICASGFYEDFLVGDQQNMIFSYDICLQGL